MGADWLVGDHAAAATERILDAAGRCFTRQGVTSTSLGDIAAEAGCSRPTVYRYFDDRAALRAAFVEREAERVGQAVLAEVDSVEDPGRRLVAGISAALRLVRDDRTLASWFDPTQSGSTEHVARASVVIASLIEPLVRADEQDLTRRRTDWVVRCILSLLSAPGVSESEERMMLADFLVPVVVYRSERPAE